MKDARSIIAISNLDESGKGKVKEFYSDYDAESLANLITTRLGTHVQAAQMEEEKPHDPEPEEVTEETSKKGRKSKDTSK